MAQIHISAFSSSVPGFSVGLFCYCFLKSEDHSRPPSPLPLLLLLPHSVALGPFLLMLGLYHLMRVSRSFEVLGSGA